MCSFPEYPFDGAFGVEQRDRVDPELHQPKLCQATTLPGCGDELASSSHQTGSNLGISDADVPHQVVELEIAVVTGLQGSIDIDERVSSVVGTTPEKLQSSEESLADSGTRGHTAHPKGVASLDEVSLSVLKQPVARRSMVQAVAVFHEVHREIVLDARNERMVALCESDGSVEMHTCIHELAHHARSDAHVLGGNSFLTVADAKAIGLRE